MRTNIITTPVRKISSGQTAHEQDFLSVEEPLEIRIGDRNVAITMRTPGNDEELAAGFLFTEGILQPADIAAIEIPERNLAVVTLRDPNINLDRLDRNFYISSSCGVCGKASIESLEVTGCTVPPRDRPIVDSAIIASLPAKLRSHQAAFERTGGLHAAALFAPDGTLIALREDVGRHNAVDKLIGSMLASVPLNNHILMLSGRISFELVQKALMAGIAVIAAVGAPSSLAVETALRFGVTLAGFVRDGRFNLYSGDQRVTNSSSAPSSDPQNSSQSTTPA